MAQEMATEGTKHAIDALSIVTVIGTIGDVLPPLAALFTIVWTGLRIYETQTVQQMLGKVPPDDT
jgi:FtsH-binding integral membrane protein